MSFVGDSEGMEFVHARHPLMLLVRHLERGTRFDAPWCSGDVPSDMLDKTLMLVWAIGSLEGYANRAELLCAAIDCVTEEVSPIPFEHAQKLLKAMSTPNDMGLGYGLDLEALKDRVEHALLSEFNNIAKVFTERDRILAEKARSAVRSHSRRQLARNERQLAKDGLNVSLRNMFVGWNRRIESETESKLAEIEMRIGIRSSVEVIGMAVLSPQRKAQSDNG